MRRTLLIFAIALGLLTPIFWRAQVDPDPQGLTIIATPLDASKFTSEELRLTGAWQLHAPHPFFGGFSALVVGEGELIAGSDRGWMLRLPLSEGAPDVASARFGYYAHPRDSYKDMNDLEAFARDPETGALWSAYEYFNAILREDAQGNVTFRDPPEMRRWTQNSGPEAMVRLSDGRFIVLAEGEVDRGGELHNGLIFAGDPITATEPSPFYLKVSSGYAPVDATQLPEGDVLILLRRVEYTVPATFEAAIMRADPADIAPDGTWEGEIIAELSGDILGENFEGIAFVSGPDNSGALYLIADDNLSIFQRSLLIRLEPIRAE